ncbi:hypothetical protein ENSA5_55840 [Enhygromyxa salina]|uniref:DUF4166 domain-containing protein n=1 Tax=Enhygromyxa salina TaxID=215803 RepID=A0A2S9XES9_9BACT|nr:DUF4166 domain-containing protein [Enhygromyxa salina]PRP91373.1 hypothetical protein ENSA5_55840 [Enhygromyxa salina]
MAPRPTLYEAVLGEGFAALPATLRHFHGRPAGGEARGTVRVSRGRGLLARLAAWLMRAPAPGEGVAVVLAVAVERDREVWMRSFAGQPMVTRQWRVGPDLVEAVGPSRLHFELHADAEGMVFEQRRCTLLGLPVPRVLAPRVCARALVGASTPADAWELHVSVALPLVGVVVEYSGTMIAEPPDDLDHLDYLDHLDHLDH